MEDSKIILINKRHGITSHKVIKEIQAKYGFKKIGHAGTLDPMAQGLIVAMSNNATKLSDLLMKKDKVYLVKMKLGSETDTLDSEGSVIKSMPYEDVTLDKIKEAMNKFVGKIMQKPPMYSAIKHNGQKLYKLARQNIVVDIKEREININYIKNIRYNNGVIEFEVSVSSGTYIRSLVRDIAYELNTCATMIYLFREQIDIFKAPIGDNVEMYSIHDYFKLNNIVLCDEKIKNILNGMTLNLDKKCDDKMLHCYDKNNRYLGIVEVICRGKIKRSKFFLTREDYEKD